MAKSASYHVPFRRRREGKTNYHRRIGLLQSDAHRLVVRRSNKHQRVSVIKAKVIGDETLAAASSQHLKEYGWKGSTGNVSAAYLTGYLAGKYAQSVGIKEAILDIGINLCLKDSRISAMLCGAVQSGLDIPHDPKVFPSEERITGQIIADYAAKLKKDKSDDYDKQFSGYKKTSTKPESLPSYFKETKKAIDAEFSSGSMLTKLKSRNKKNKIIKPKTTKKVSPTPPQKASPSKTAASKDSTVKQTPSSTTKPVKDFVIAPTKIQKASITEQPKKPVKLETTPEKKPIPIKAKPSKEAKTPVATDKKPSTIIAKDAKKPSSDTKTKK